MHFKSLEFNINQDLLNVSLYNIFYFEIPLEEIRKIDKNFKLKNKNEIIFSKNTDKNSDRKFMFLIEKYMPELKNKITKLKAVYIHQNSGIPLFGLKFIGIIDKGTDMIEIKPLTSCNMNCIFCSVGEGLSSKKQVDFIVEEEYIISELAKLIDYKKKKGNTIPLSIWINPHGEPLLYSRITDLVKDISKLLLIKDVHIITSGVLLNKVMIDELAKIKKVKLNISISSFDSEKAVQLMGTKTYNLANVLNNVKYASEKGIETIITPVYLHGINDKDIEQLIEFCKHNQIPISIQKFCCNMFGRNPIKEEEWDSFMAKLKTWEKKYNISLIGEGEIQSTQELPLMFKKGDVVQAEIISYGRFFKDKIAVAKARCILIPNCRKEKGVIKVKITSAVNGMYIGSA
ncbi:radical SAM protein [Candidatus Woesearchaeota archaeon]|nr:radical SAM protein [Candidatus Woesearchaeota archaeon]